MFFISIRWSKFYSSSAKFHVDSMIVARALVAMAPFLDNMWGVHLGCVSCENALNVTSVVKISLLVDRYGNISSPLRGMGTCLVSTFTGLKHM